MKFETLKEKEFYNYINDKLQGIDKESMFINTIKDNQINDTIKIVKGTNEGYYIEAIQSFEKEYIIISVRIHDKNEALKAFNSLVEVF